MISHEFSMSRIKIEDLELLYENRFKEIIEPLDFEHFDSYNEQIKQLIYRFKDILFKIEDNTIIFE